MKRKRKRKRKKKEEEKEEERNCDVTSVCASSVAGQEEIGKRKELGRV